MRASSRDILGLVDKSETTKTGFAIQRFVELLDPMTPFFHSVHLSISPQESVREALDLLQMHRDKPSFVKYHLIACLRRTLKLLKNDPFIQSNFEETSDLKDYLGVFLKELDEIPKSKASGVNGRTEFISTNVNELEECLKNSLNEMNIHYLQRALKKLDRAINSRFGEDKQYRHIDSSLTAISRSLVDNGRSPRQTLRSFSVRLGELSVLGPQNFIAVLEQLMLEKQREYEVAIVLDGTHKIDRFEKLPEEVRTRIKIIRKGHERWFSEADTSLLKSFCKKHWGSVIKPKARRSQAKTPDCVIAIVKVDAWDEDGAREKALALADQIVDLVNVANRGKRIGVKRKVLVLDVLANRQTRKQGDTRVHDELQPLPINSYSAISNSLRFASRLKTERSKTVSVLFAWIALESFFSGSSDAQKKVIEKISLLGSRAASRGIVLDCRKMLRVELSNMHYEKHDEKLDVDEITRVRNLNLFDSHQYLIKNTDGFAELKPYLSPLAYWRFRETVKKYNSGDSVSAHIVEITENIEWALTRMAHYRNQTVHSAQTENTAETSLAPLGAEIIDFTLEVVSILDKQKPANFQLAIEDYAGRIRDQINEWGRDSGKSPQLLGERDESEYRDTASSDETSSA